MFGNYPAPTVSDLGRCQEVLVSRVNPGQYPLNNARFVNHERPGVFPLPATFRLGGILSDVVPVVRFDEVLYPKVPNVTEVDRELYVNRSVPTTDTRSRRLCGGNRHVSEKNERGTLSRNTQMEAEASQEIAVTATSQPANQRSKARAVLRHRW